MISDDQLAELERLANAATPGPWYIHEDDPYTVLSWDGDTSVYEVSYHGEMPDAAFIAAARDAVPALIARVRELEKDLDGMCHDQTVLELKNEQLEKEADWLANRHWPHYHKDNQLYDICHGKELMPQDCMKCWRKAARLACSETLDTP